ncbi:dermonecrotic toxin domain-containing protein [Stenotrophomonas sp. AB1(2024)]|uniref:dermonecrotic toxin domain-containing protein n=1 Tax=Stenotrophomonas sp. AB1(2024) TaxID=3132215 RepID=UPI0030B2B1D0
MIDGARQAVPSASPWSYSAAHRSGSQARATVALESVGNRCAVAPERLLWLSGVPQQELDALSAALRQGPLDAHFFLSLEPTFHRTALAAPMAQVLVDDALQGLLPKRLPRAQRDAWRSCLAGLLVLPRAAWGVACMPVRAQLTHAVAATNALLGVMRDVLYRPYDMPVRDWQAALERERAGGMLDCRDVALGQQAAPRAVQCARARQQLERWFPQLTARRLECAVSRLIAVADRDAGCIDPRMALTALFDAVDSECRTLVPEAGRVAVLSSLEMLADDAAVPLLATSGGAGDCLGHWLLSVAERAGHAPERRTGFRRALAEALVYAVSAVPSLLTNSAGGGSVEGMAATFLGTAAEPSLRVPHVVGSVASGAAPQGGHGLLAMAAGLVGSGSGLAALGWHWAFGTTPTAPLPTGAEEAVALLDSVIAPDDSGTLWHALWRRVHAAGRDRPWRLVAEVSEQLEANQIGAEVMAAFGLSAVNSEVEAARRVRRTADAMRPPTAGRAVQRWNEQLQRTSALLIDAARSAPEPDSLPLLRDPGLDIASMRSRLLTWIQAMGTNTSTQHARLSAAWRDIVAAEQALAQAWAALPQLDAYLTEQVASDLRSVTGRPIDPLQIYLNAFQVSETWPEWEARQLRPPRVVLSNRPGLQSRLQWVRSGLVSSHTLVGAALLTAQAAPDHAGLYYRATPETYFPVQECRELTLPQFKQAVAGRDYLAAFRQRFDSCVEDAWHGRPSAASQHFMEGFTRRLSGAAMLLNAAGQLSDEAVALVQVLIDFPARFDMAEPSKGRALAMPGRQIEVHALAANASGQAVPLHGVVLVTATDLTEPTSLPVLVISDTRSPFVEAFESRDGALQRLAVEVRQHLPARVAVTDHAHWQRGYLPVVPAYAIDGDFRWAMFRQSLQLRHAQLRPPMPTAPDRVRHRFNALETVLRSPLPPVPIPLLAAAGELAALTPADITAHGAAHWMARFPADTPGALRNLGMDGARWLHALSAGRSLLAGRYPGLVPFAQQVLDDEILQRYGIAFDSRGAYIVAFSGGRPNDQAISGWRHTRAQRRFAVSLAECAMTRAQDLDDSSAGRLGLYRISDGDFFDESSEIADLLPAQLLSVARDLDVQGAYLARLDAFWQQYEGQVLATLRGSYLHSCWQQYADGSLSRRGAQLALGLFGDMSGRQSQDPAFLPVPRNGTLAGWLNIHGTASTILHISDDSGPEVLLFVAHSGNRFYEFSNALDLMGWVERVAATETGRGWLESAFDLADLQDGWVSNGVHSALGDGAQTMFSDGCAASVVHGEASTALVRRLRERSRRDAQTLMTSPWEAFRRRWMPRLEQFDEAVGLASVLVPALLPVVAIGAAIELGVGVEQAIEGDTPQVRRAGVSSAAAGALGLALSAPLGTARIAALAGHDGARLEPALQASVWLQRPDPLQRLTERYSRSVSLAGVRAADNGVYDSLGRQYIEQGGHAYEVNFDRAQRTWRLRDPQPGSTYHPPVRLNADGLWEPHADVGLRGGAPEAAVGHAPLGRSSLDLTYRNALNLHLERLRLDSLDSTALDFRWGQEHWERVVAPAVLNDGSSVARMKEQFVSGILDPVQQGALSVIIERLESTLRAEHYAMMEIMVADEVGVAGGRFHPASQGLLGEASGSASGMCTGLSRIMATALARGEEFAVLDNLRQAIAAPLEARSVATFAAVRDAQGAALERGTMSSTSLIATSHLARFLAGVAENTEFILSGSRHSMACAIRVAENGQREWILYDPNFGLMSFTHEDRFGRWLNTLFTSRAFSGLLDAGQEEMPQTLAELYGAFSTQGSARFQFHLRQVHASRLQAQSFVRGWERMLGPPSQATGAAGGMTI